MGLKQIARAAMEENGVPILPGSTGILKSLEEAVETAERIGYPVMLKASAGGGGRGMRIVRQQEELGPLMAQAQAEAAAAFSCGDLYMEKLVENPRHIEFQVLADQHGEVEILGERECSIQRRHQKLIEESPSTAMTPELRQCTADRLRAALKAVGYANAGTVEFLMDAAGKLYFIEVNARIQVEHPVTEMITGIDLIKEQIRIASGMPLTYRQPDIRITGHSFECRINAEDPEKFTPSPGLVTRYHPPGGMGVRVDSAMEANCMVVPYYDSMIAKLITHGRDREEGIARMRRALDEFTIDGIKTTIPLHRRIFNDAEFLKGRVSTNFLDRLLADQSS
jgi:acetyl-CoA carboxylase biotin carboxylase subunit